MTDIKMLKKSWLNSLKTKNSTKNKEFNKNFSKSLLRNETAAEPTNETKYGENAFHRLCRQIKSRRTIHYSNTRLENPGEKLKLRNRSFQGSQGSGNQGGFSDKEKPRFSERGRKSFEMP